MTVTFQGGAQGIGAATVALLHSHGAHVFFGDWDVAKGRTVEQTLQSSKNEIGGSAIFQKLDVRDYQSQLALFDSAWRSHGQVDVAISCAAVKEPPGWFEPEDLDRTTVRKASDAHSKNNSSGGLTIDSRTQLLSKITSTLT